MAETIYKPDSNSPAFKNSAYNYMSPAWCIVADVAEGTRKLRELATKYLPRESAEQQSEYSTRLSRAVFFNAFERTLHALVGMVFRKEPQFGEDVPEQIAGTEAAEGQERVEGFAEDIDLAGTHWTVFAKELFTKAVRDGHALIYVDMPPKVTRADGLPPTLEDEKRAQMRPYWVMYEACQAVNWRVNKRGKLELLVLEEKLCVPDGEYGEKEICQYRVLRPGSWELYQETDGPNQKKEYVLIEAGRTNLSEIPVAVVYSRKEGWLKSRPPLLDLAFINIAHFQKYSDFSIYLHLCKPILWFAERDRSKNVEAIGAYTFFDVNKDGQVAFAEPTGSALEACSTDIKDLEERMSVLGTSLLVKNNVETTATEELGDNAKESSDLATAARSLKDALELALKFTVQYQDANAKSGGSVELGSSIEELSFTAQEIQALSGLVSANQLPVEVAWQLLRGTKWLPGDFDETKAKGLLDAEAQKAAERAASVFNQGGNPAEMEQ